MNRTTATRRLVAIAALALAVAACSSGGGSPSPTTTPASAPTGSAPPTASPVDGSPQPSTAAPPGVGEIQCAGGATGGDIDYVSDAPGGLDDLETATRALRGVLPSDRVVIEGERSGIVRGGRTVFTGQWFRSTTGGWLLSSFNACGDAKIALGPPRGLVRDAMAEVLVDGLRVRGLPSTADDSVKFEHLLGRGDRLFVVDGPVQADGYAWYLVQSLIQGAQPGPFGWVAAASRDGEDWIDDVEDTNCPTIAEEGGRIGVLPPELLIHCFGSAELAFTAEAHLFCRADEARAIDPAWFGAGCGLLSGDACGSCGLSLAASPEGAVELPTDGSQNWRISGHFDDAAAASCRGTTAPAGDSVLPAEYLVHFCRTTFVVTSLASSPID